MRYNKSLVNLGSSHVCFVQNQFESLARQSIKCWSASHRNFCDYLLYSYLWVYLAVMPILENQNKNKKIV